MKTIISITFDDGNESCHSEALPILEKFGVRGSFYITTEEIGTPDKMTLKQIEDLHSSGHEIGSHTHTHPLLTSTPDSQLDNELKISKEILDSFNPATLAYPCGNHDERVVSAVKKHYIAARCYYEEAGSGINKLPVSGDDVYTLKDIPLSDYKIISNEHDNPVWLIFTFHLYGRLSLKRFLWGLSNGRLKISTVKKLLSGMIRKAEPAISEIEYLRLICECADDGGIEILPVREVLEKYCGQNA